MKTIGELVCVSVLAGCSTRPFRPAEPVAATVRREIEQWRKCFRKDYWLVPSPSKS
jgi:hypothetical protein